MRLYSILGQNATKAQIHQFNVLHHLNEPYFIQLWDTIKGVFTFDLGTTYKGNDVVTKAVGERIPITIIVAVLALIVALIIAIPIGIISAMKRNSWLDITLMIIALIGFVYSKFLARVIIHFSVLIEIGYFATILYARTSNIVDFTCTCHWNKYCCFYHAYDKVFCT